MSQQTEGECFEIQTIQVTHNFKDSISLTPEALSLFFTMYYIASKVTNPTTELRDLFLSLQIRFWYKQLGKE